MRVLFEITHPKHAHLFKNAIIKLKQTGHQVRITSREKDVTTALLDSWALEIGDHQVLSKHAGKGMLKLAGELLLRDYRLLKVVREFKPDVIVARVGPSAAHVGFLLGIPVIVFEDTDDAALQQWISFPLVTHVCTAQHYAKNWGRKHLRYNSFDEMAYLHPNRFIPDDEIVRSAGLLPGEYIIVRFVSWQAAHDVNQSGIDSDVQMKVIEALARHYRVVISSEQPLPDTLKSMKLDVAPEDFHHILAYSRLVFSESSTVVTEAALLGVPGILINTMHWSSVDRLINDFQLVYQTTDCQLALNKAIEWLSNPEWEKNLHQAGKRIRESCDDLTVWMLELIELTGGRKQVQTGPDKN